MKLIDIVSTLYIPIQKITDYALDLNNPNSKDKAFMFHQHLGYSQDNYQYLIEQIESKALEKDAIPKDIDEYGARYQIDLEILGNYEGQKEIVRTGWIVRPNSNVAQLTTLYITRKK